MSNINNDKIPTEEENMKGNKKKKRMWINEVNGLLLEDAIKHIEKKISNIFY
jgi:hypothetical protein